MSTASLVSTAAVVTATVARLNTIWTPVSTASATLTATGGLHKQNVLGPIGSKTVPWFDFPS